MGKRVTAADVARSLGVSRATVGFVLNNTPGQSISAATRERVIAEARRLGYRPHKAAQALARGQSNIVLLVLPDWPIDFNMRVNIDEAGSILDQAGLSLVTMTRRPQMKARPLWETLSPDVVMSMVPLTPDEISDIRACGVRKVISGAPGDDSDEVPRMSFTEGPHVQVEALINRGVDRLVFADTSDTRLYDLATARYEMARQVCAERTGLDLERAVVTAENARDLVARWRSEGIRGVVAYNDETAAEVVGAAIRLGVRIPQELSVVGHDDAPIASLMVPSITTVRVDNVGIGRYMGELAKFAYADDGDPRDIQQPATQVSLIERETMAPAPTPDAANNPS